jgi:dephospho-CoA kinase
MLKVGLTGGYATGKSFVAKELERLGAHVIYADQLGHAVLHPGGEAYEPTLNTFGRDILNPDGTIDRKKLAAKAFASPDLLEKLTSYVHPAVFRLEEALLNEFQAADPTGIAVIEAAILIETGRHTHFDRLILTTCDVDTQIARGMKRDGCTREEAMSRIDRQMPFEQKKSLADYIIDTTGTKEETSRRVQAILNDLKELAKDRQTCD